MKTPLLAVGLLAGQLVLPSAAADRMPLAEVQPGMVGVGVTVFEGATREEFTAHVIGVLHNINGPQRSLILARLGGGPLARTGVLQGMSGSPVYVDGRLIGAVSYALGAFPTEAIAGITPIDEMIDAVARPASRPPLPELALELPMSPMRLVDVFRTALRPLTTFAPRASDVDGLAVSLFEARQATALLRPITTPVVLSGFEPDTAELLSSTFRGTGLTPVLGDAQAGAVSIPTDGPLQGGDAISVTLIDGDLTLAGTGTVTMVEGDRVYAFGHPVPEPRTDPIHHEPGLHPHALAQLDVVDEDCHRRRGDRNISAGPPDGDRRHDRRHAADDSRRHHVANGRWPPSRPPTAFHHRRRPCPHALAGLRDGAEHIAGVRAGRWRGYVAPVLVRHACAARRR